MKVERERICVCLLAALLALAASVSEGKQPSRASKDATNVHSTQTPSSSVHSTQTSLSLAQYRAHVRESVARLEDLASFCELLSRSEKPEVWSRKDFNPDVALEFPKRERDALDTVRTLLPPKERVEWAGGAIDVDNSWLNASLHEFERQSDNDRRALSLRSTAGRLRAIDSRIAEVEGDASKETADASAERGRLNEVMRDPDFDRGSRQQKESALRRAADGFFEWVRELASRLFPRGTPITPGTNPLVSQIIEVVVVALCVAVIAYFARLFWSRRRRGPKSLKLKRKARVILGERVEADQTSADLLEDAERLARSGDLRGAIRKAYVALLCELGDRQVVRLARHKTNRDYLNAVRRSDRARLYTEMLPLTSEFELHWYGLREAAETDWNDFRMRCRRVIKQSGV